MQISCPSCKPHFSAVPAAPSCSWATRYFHCSSPPPLRSCWQQLAEPRWAGGWAGASGAPISPLPTNPAALGYTVPQALLLPDDCSLCACPSLMLDLAFLQGLFSEWKKESSTIDVNWLLHNGRESREHMD